MTDRPLVSAVPGLATLVMGRANAISTSQLSRDDIWRVGVEIVREAPILGVGLRSFPAAFDDAKGRAALGSTAFDDPGAALGSHSIYLGVAAELGGVGILLFASFVWVVSRRSKAAGLIGAIHTILVALLIQAAFLDMLNRKYFWLVFGMAAGLGARELREGSRGLSGWVTARNIG